MRLRGGSGVLCTLLVCVSITWFLGLFLLWDGSPPGEHGIDATRAVHQGEEGAGGFVRIATAERQSVKAEEHETRVEEEVEKVAGRGVSGGDASNDERVGEAAVPRDDGGEETALGSPLNEKAVLWSPLDDVRDDETTTVRQNVRIEEGSKEQKEDQPEQQPEQQPEGQQQQQATTRVTNPINEKKELPRADPEQQNANDTTYEIVRNPPVILLEQQKANEEETEPDEDVTIGEGTPQEGLAEIQVLRNAAILLIVYNRPAYMQKTLTNLQNVHGINNVTVFISQDGNDTATRKMAMRYTPHFKYIQHPRIPLLSPKQGPVAYLAQHYKWALDTLFFERGHSHVIILEDDMLVAPDFLSFFEQTAPLLDADPSLWCISSWNDNGFKKLVDDPTRLYRTSYFPGLGWMLRRELWDELSPKFPLEHWDHWMRISSVNKGRECIFPEVSRNYNIGEKGVNVLATEYKRYFREIRLNDQPVLFGDLTYLLKHHYTSMVRELIEKATIVQGPGAVGSRLIHMFTDKSNEVFLIPYKREEFKSIAIALALWKSPRGHHHFAQIVKYMNNILVLADVRQCPYLPEHLRIVPAEDLDVRVGDQGKSCSDTCMQYHQLCDASQFEFINVCQELERGFPCERGCTLVVGYDVPNYVNDPNDEHHQKCLFTDDFSKCTSAHRSTRRLCPCRSRENGPYPSYLGTRLPYRSKAIG